MEGEEPVAVEVEYITTSDLPAPENPTEAVATMLEGLGSKDWVAICDALLKLRCLAKFHPELLDGPMPTAADLVLKAVKNPRSALCKSALMAVADLFLFLKQRMLPFMDALLLPLLLKASQDKKFVADEALAALSRFGTSVPPGDVVNLLSPYLKHKNPRVRARATMTFHTCLESMESSTSDSPSLTVENLLPLVAPRISDPLPESRDAARKCVILLRTKYLAEHPSAAEAEGTSGARTDAQQPQESSAAAAGIREDAHGAAVGSSPSIPRPGSSGPEGTALQSTARASVSTTAAEHGGVLAWEQQCKGSLGATDAAAVLRLGW